MGEFPEVRYRVILTARTEGSSAASSRNRTTGSKDSYGTCSSLSPADISSHIEEPSGGSRLCTEGQAWSRSRAAFSGGR